MDQVIALLQSAVCFGTVISFGAIGEIITEKSGNLNLGVPGIMSLGAIGSLITSFYYERAVTTPNAFIAFLVAILGAVILSLLGGLIYSFLTITLRANQNVTGLTLTIFGCGFANFYGGALNILAGGVGQISLPATRDAFHATLPFLKNVPLLKSFGFLVYVAIILSIFVQYFINKTKTGLKLRAVGENPATADAAGINVTRYKYISILVGSIISGIGGAYYTMDYLKGTWASDGGIEALGWLAVALVIFATWKPISAILGSYLFGILSWLYFYIEGLSRSSQQIFKMFPYVVTIVVLVVVSLRRKKESQPPESLGLAYFRENR